MEELLKLWNLTTHPFSPVADPPFKNDLLEPLDPRRDPRLLKFYFDLYNWDRSKLVRLIALDEKLEYFPKQNELPDPKSLLILLVGPDNTGRASLSNLILHKIQSQSGQQPIEVAVDLDSLDPSANVAQIASGFLDTYDLLKEATPAFEDLQRVYQREEPNPRPGLGSFYSPLFQAWKRRMAANPRPPVLLITGVNDYDSWRVIYNSAWHLFPFIVVLTTAERDALTCYNLLLGERKNVVMIKSRELEQASAKAYLQARLSLAQVDPEAARRPDQLEPFTEAALTALYQRGPTAQPGKPVKFDMHWLNRIFKRVLDDHLESLEQIKREQGQASFDKLPREQLLIGAGKLGEAAEKQNQGH